MKLIDIIYKIILKEATDDIEDRPSDEEIERDEFEFPSDEELARDEFEFPSDEERPVERPRDEERPREDREMPRIGNWICKDPVDFPGCEQIRDDEGIEITTTYGFPFYINQKECIDASPCEGERRPTTRPTRPTRPVRITTPRAEPEQSTAVQLGDTQPTTTTTDTVSVPEINMGTKYDSDDSIKSIKKVQSNKFIQMVEDKLTKQLDLQPANVKQKLNQFNIRPQNMSFLVPLSIETGTLMSKMEMDGLNLPLMMVLYKNTDGLYKAMTENTIFKESQAKPITGPISYKNFWKWNEEVYNSWGTWIRDNVVSNFPEISRNSFPSLSF